MIKDTYIGHIFCTFTRKSIVQWGQLLGTVHGCRTCYQACCISCNGYTDATNTTHQNMRLCDGPELKTYYFTIRVQDCPASLLSACFSALSSLSLCWSLHFSLSQLASWPTLSSSFTCSFCYVWWYKISIHIMWHI